MASRTTVGVGLLVASAGLVAVKTAGEWRAMSRHLPTSDPRARRARRLGVAGAACGVAAAALHWSARGSGWPPAAFAIVVGLYVVGLLLGVVAHLRFVRIAPPEYWDGPAAP